MKIQNVPVRQENHPMTGTCYVIGGLWAALWTFVFLSMAWGWLKGEHESIKAILIMYGIFSAPGWLLVYVGSALPKTNIAKWQ
ncbi:MAG: hypothetical protein AAFR02_00105 [Pseudomonadota bacterium]